MAFLSKGPVCAQLRCIVVLRVTVHPELTWFMSADTLPTEVPTCAEKHNPKSRGGFPPRIAVALLMDWRELKPRCTEQRDI